LAQHAKRGPCRRSKVQAGRTAGSIDAQLNALARTVDDRVMRRA
jgi:hypothetical protein